MDFSLLDVFLNTDVVLTQLVAQYGAWVYVILFAIIFAETGLVFMPFLPGDSLLFVAGAVAAAGGMDPVGIGATIFTAAILGDSTNYWVGRTAGERLFVNKESRFFRRDYLQRTQDFYAKHGGKTVALARFVPIVRTFAPFVAGVGRMPYLRFVAFSVLGSAVWVLSLVALGYWFGNHPFVRGSLSVMVLVVVGLSLLPAVVAAVRQRYLATRPG